MIKGSPRQSFTCECAPRMAKVASEVDKHWRLVAGARSFAARSLAVRTKRLELSHKEREVVVVGQSGAACPAKPQSRERGSV